MVGKEKKGTATFSLVVVAVHLTQLLDAVALCGAKLAVGLADLERRVDLVECSICRGESATELVVALWTHAESEWKGSKRGAKSRSFPRELTGQSPGVTQSVRPTSQRTLTLYDPILVSC